MHLSSFLQIPLSNYIPNCIFYAANMLRTSFFCCIVIFFLLLVCAFIIVCPSVLPSFTLYLNSFMFLFLPFHWSIPLFSHMSIFQLTGHKSAALLYRGTVLYVHKRTTPQWVCIYEGMWINCIYVRVHLLHVSHRRSMLLGDFPFPSNIYTLFFKYFYKSFCHLNMHLLSGCQIIWVFF